MLDGLALHSSSSQLDQLQESASSLLLACRPWLLQKRRHKSAGQKRKPSQPARMVLSTLAGALTSLDISYTAEVRLAYWCCA